MTNEEYAAFGVKTVRLYDTISREIKKITENGGDIFNPRSFFVRWNQRMHLIILFVKEISVCISLLMYLLFFHIMPIFTRIGVCIGMPMISGNLSVMLEYRKQA